MVNGQVAEHMSQTRCRAVEELAAEVLAELYRTLAGEPPRAVRGYREGSSLLVLIRFDPAPLQDGPDWRERLEATFIATLELLAEAVGARCNRRLEAGAVELCGSGKLAAFSLSLEREDLAGTPAPTLVPLADRLGLAP